MRDLPPPRPKPRSHYIGVSFHRSGRWAARINPGAHAQGPQKLIGLYPTAAEAAKAYDEAARAIYGPYANTNFSQDEDT
jgi:hypothetical protein